MSPSAAAYWAVFKQFSSWSRFLINENLNPVVYNPNRHDYPTLRTALVGISTDNFFKNFILGVTNECIKVDSRSHNRDAVTKLLHSARDDVVIVSRYLDPTIYNNEEISSAALQHVKHSKHNSIRILVHDTAPMVKNGHRLLDLSQRVSSKIEVRTICDDYSQFNQSFLVADTIGYIHNLKSDLYEAEVNFNDKDRSKELMENFKEIWESSTQDTAIRRLCI